MALISKYRLPLLLIACVLFSGSLPGCGGKVDGTRGIQEANKTNIRRVTNLYSRYMLFHAGKGPANEQEFKSYIAGLDAGTLSNIGVDAGKLDDLFKSERDGQSFEVVYAITGSTRGSNDAVVFEKTGKDGAREVGFTSLAIRSLNESEISGLKAAKPTGQSGANLPPGAGR